MSENLADHSVETSIHPVYRRSRPQPHEIIDFASDTTHIDFVHAHTPSYPSEPVDLSSFTALFDARAAAAVSDAAGFFRRIRVSPGDPPVGKHLEDVLLEFKTFWSDDEEQAPPVLIPRGKCLAVLAYPDYFPEVDVQPELTGGGISAGEKLRRMVSDAMLMASPGWCGTFGPGVDGLFDVTGDPLEGNYDMSQMHLLQIAYSYYNELSPDARERLITVLLATGRIHRPDADDIVTSGGVPDDWSRAGHIHAGPAKIRIGETENHILTIHTARYLTNQLLYQRDHDPNHDNRRNGSEGAPTCTELMLILLRNMLRDDFSEYNAKPYQTETRSALLNLCTYAYDHEVRLAARMVLDYISAHIAVSSNDLRRLVPFRRLNKDEHVTRLSQQGFDRDFLDVGLLDTEFGADPMVEPFAIQAGNIRGYEKPAPARPWPAGWAIAGDGGAAVAEVVSNYRLPPSIHDLFVNDLHRSFFQRLHRFRRFDEVEGAGALDEDARGISGRNADNMEIYASSPSYLISAGGAPAIYAIDPGPSILFEKGRHKAAQQLGVAVPTSFMPTGRRAGEGTQNRARDLIQFSSFSDGFSFTRDGEVVESSPTVANYGVAPDFACGHKVHLPLWVSAGSQLDGQFLFVDKGSPVPLPGVATEPPGFYLAIFNDGEFAFLEAFDTWLHPGVTFEDFKRGIKEANRNIKIENNVECQYMTRNGNRLHFVIWKDGKRENDTVHGARVLRIEYGDPDRVDRARDAGNITHRFLTGTIMNSAEEAKIEIDNPRFGAKGSRITLDMSNLWQPRRTSESGEVEEAGSQHEVWVDFAWSGPSEGDFYRPFSTITAAAAAVADGGTIKMMPGWTTERPSFQRNRRIRLTAPGGGVTFGVR